jgi:REP element-mobilizing transposase RayT
MTRGVNRGKIFFDQVDYRRYLELLADVRAAAGVTVLAYALMPNHVHLLVEDPGGRLSPFFHNLNSRYALWFNKRHGRVGHLFQGRFRSYPVQDAAYLATVVAYIHRNPVKAGLSQRAEDYPWSSRRELAAPAGLSGAAARVDVARLAELVPLEAITELEGGESLQMPDAVLDPFARRPRGPGTRLSEARALALFADAVGGPDAAFDALPRVRQEEVVRDLVRRGLSFRQVAIATGWGVASVHRVVRGG